MTRRAWAAVDLAAVRANAAALAAAVAPAALCAVVKANAYGHGAVPVARAALEGGATWLAVALVEEGIELRESGIEAPVLLLSEPPADAVADAVAAALTLTLYSRIGIERAAAAAANRGAGPAPVPVHLKVDTGMHRVGADPGDAVGLARAITDAPGLSLEGLWTHFAGADEARLDADTAAQLERFDAVAAALRAAGIDPPLVHAANTAGALAHAGSRRSLVRCGIGLYGYPPVEAGALGLTPVLSLEAEVSFVRRLSAGERLSYGLRYALPADATVATVPLGYADGVPRRLSACGGVALVGGRRRPIAGTITMDQLLLDCGDAEVSVGDSVVLLGRQGSERITAEEWATALDTISYEILCGIGSRVPRVHR